MDPNILSVVFGAAMLAITLFIPIATVYLLIQLKALAFKTAAGVARIEARLDAIEQGTAGDVGTPTV